jgi:hypothetical protein
LKLGRRLEAAGFPTKQAQDTAETLADTITGTVATQADIHGVQGEIREVGLKLRAEIREVGLKLRAEIAALRAELIKWVMGIGIAAVLAVGGMILTLDIAILRALPHA